MNEDGSQADAGAASDVTLEAPVVPTGENGQYTPEEKADADEWELAAENSFDIIKRKDGTDEQTKPKEGDETGKAKDSAAKDQKQNAQPGDGNADGKGEGKDGAGKPGEGEGQAEPAEPTAAFSRLSAREQQQITREVQTDITGKMYGVVGRDGNLARDKEGNMIVRTEEGALLGRDPRGQAVLLDKDGDIISGVEDVMKHTNPNTGEPFTYEEAAAYFLNAKKDAQATLANMDSRVSELTETTLMIRDEADIINYEYGELLRALPDVRQKIWEQYSKTFKQDPKSGIITDAPVSLEAFYRTALEPYAALGRRLEAEQGQQTQQKEQQQQQQTQAKQQRRADRSDIYGGGKTDLSTDDDKEWSAAAETVFGPLK